MGDCDLSLENSVQTSFGKIAQPVVQSMYKLISVDHLQTHSVHLVFPIFFESSEWNGDDRREEEKESEDLRSGRSDVETDPE